MTDNHDSHTTAHVAVGDNAAVKLNDSDRYEAWRGVSGVEGSAARVAIAASVSLLSYSLVLSVYDNACIVYRPECLCR